MKQNSQMENKDRKCRHCNAPIVDERFNVEFCCNGCKQVYELISENGLSQYYEYREFDKKKEFQAVNYADRTFDYLDSDDFKKNNVREASSKDGDISVVSFFLTGVQCPACVWLVEKLSDFSKGVIKAELNFRTCIVKIHYDKKLAKLSEIAIKLNRLGYLPKPYHPKTEEKLNKDARRLLLLQLGVAGFCAGNTMLLAISLYQGYFSGIAYNYKNFIHVISLLLTLPVISFSAEPFFKAAFASLKIKRLHIDVPISIGIISAFLFSSYNLVVGDDHVYFDSICMLVFLLLIGRFLQKVAIDKVFNNSVEDYLLPSFARIKDLNGNHREEDIKKVQVDQELIVYKNEIIPVDGELVNSKSSVSNAFLTGESKPISVSSGSQVFAGAKNISEPITVIAKKDYYSSRIYKLISMVNDTKLENSKTSNVFTNIFVTCVFGLSLFCLAYWVAKDSLEFGLINAISILIITCPCALGLARPLVVAKVVNELAKKDIFLKNEKFFDLFNSIKDIYFDKTGTLTNGEFEVQNFVLVDSVNYNDLLEKICFLEGQTEHPIKNAFLNLRKEEFKKFNLKDFKTFQGLGITGVFDDGSVLSLGSKKFLDQNKIVLNSSSSKKIESIIESKNTLVYVFNEESLLAVFEIADSLREGIDGFISDLKTDKEIYIVSGDNSKVVNSVGESLGLNKNNLYSELLPEDKAKIIKSKQSINCMFGDGANDAQALREASLSVGVGGSSEVNLLVADLFISKPSVKKFRYIFSGLKLAKFVINRNVSFSILYNVIGGYLAFFGYINPLTAAILMPFSSLTVIFSSLMYRLK